MSAAAPLEHVHAPTAALIDGLAVHRLTRLATRDHLPPAEKLRHAATRALGDSPWSVLPTCPWCCSWWIGVAVTAGHALVAARWGERGHRAWTLAMLPWALSSIAGLLSDLESR